MSEHTPGKLRAGQVDNRDGLERAYLRAEDVDGQPYVAVCPPPLAGDHKTNAIRLAACWNACHSIPTEALEAGAIAELLAAAEAAVEAMSDGTTIATGGKVSIHFGIPSSVFDALRSAVARARGEAPPA